jgi:tripartite-type tricarboxylate transporter receptor subunit TctC
MCTSSNVATKYVSRIREVLLCLVVASLCSWTGAAAAAEGNFYQGKTVRIIVAFSPGGGFDMLARIMARHMPQYIPGHPHILVQNMPGGGNSIGVNYVYNVAPPDGLTIGMVHGNKIVQQMTKVPGIEFDVTKFHWVGGDDLGPLALSIRKDLPYRTAKELQESKTTLHLPASVGSNGSDYLLILKNFAGMNLTPVYGFHSTPGMIMAIRRHEGDGRAGSLFTLRRYLDLLRVVVSNKRARQWIPNVEVDRELVTSEEGRHLIDALQLPQQIGRGVFLRPGVPLDRVAVIRTAWAKVIRDPGFLAEVKKVLLGSPSDFLTGPEAEQVMSQTRELPAKTWKQLIETRKRGLN